MKMNITKKGSFFKALFCILIALTCLFAPQLGLAEPGDKWQYAGVIVGGLAAVAYLKKCFERR